MPAVGTPEPGGLSWRELTHAAAPHVRARTRGRAATWSSCARFPGMASPNFIAAKLVYKLLTYKFGLARSGILHPYRLRKRIVPELRDLLPRLGHVR